MFCSLRCGFCSRNLKIMVGEIKLRLLCPTEASGRQAQGGAMCPVPGAWTPLPPPPTWLQPRISTEGGRGGRRHCGPPSGGFQESAQTPSLYIPLAKV